MFPGFSNSSSAYSTRTVSPPPTPPIIDIDLETGDLSQFTSTSGTGLSAAEAAAMDGTVCGLQVVIDSTTARYGQYAIASPYNTSGVVRARFYIDPNSLTMEDFNSFSVLTFSRSSGVTVVGDVKLRRRDTNYQIFANLINDTFSEEATGFVNISDAPHYIEVKLTRATDSTSLDGRLDWWIDGVAQTPVTGKDNYDAFTSLGVVRLGAVASIDAGTSGTFYLDELIVNDDGSEIGA